ncbi:SAM-dependent methyltransferase [Actinoplanes sp. NEAU-A12]|uniref:SAM-dependent methyltransferase n=1 Tax=Actinoplanes sandaracinus TaxID=3045177 RepID=A0ABT6X1F0_9ACTN|nr:SAM-dependent methyltransferase [Actinoplanes sandaracinus]MDI6105818.1 SAM-dependent methyltransferase [Actinoplanes sandaracinus]
MSTPQPPIDPNRPSAARIYDVYLGGGHNFASDRAVAARAVELLPETPSVARANRAFLRRAVRYATARGIRQFLDLGSGIPAGDNVHQVARSTAEDCRVAYADIDPTAVLYTRHLLDGDPRTVVIQGDLQRPAMILHQPAVRDLLDLSRPVGILMLAVLHYLPDGPALDAAMDAYREAAPPGSVLAISHLTFGDDPALVDRVADLYNRTGTPLVPRDADRVGRFFEGWRLVEPGLVHSPRWRPDDGDEPVSDAAQRLTLAGVAER